MAARRALHQTQDGSKYKAPAGTFSHVVVGVAPDGLHHVLSWHPDVSAAAEHMRDAVEAHPDAVFASRHVEGINGGERPAVVP